MYKYMKNDYETIKEIVMNYRSTSYSWLLFAFVLLFAQTANSANPVAALSKSNGASNKAPLFVYFDATGSTDADTSHPIHDLTYCFDVNTAADSTDTYSIANAGGDFLDFQKDTFCGGPQFAHVYESAGSYTASVTAIDPEGNSSTATVSVTVTAYASTETLCVSDNTDPTNYTGCPGGSTQKVEGSTGYVTGRDAINTALSGTQCNSGSTACKQILFKAGGTYRFSDSSNLNVDGVHIGAYGTGNNGRFIGVNNVAFDCGNNKEVFNIDNDDIRVSNMDWTDSCIGSSAATAQMSFILCNASPTGDSDYILVRKVKSDNTRTVLSCAANAQGDYSDFVIPTNIGFFENEFTDCGNMGSNCFFNAVKRQTYVGNLLSDAIDGEHILRMQHVGQDASGTGGAFVFANKFQLQKSTKSLLTIRAGGLMCAQSKNWGGNFWSELAQVSNNYFISNGSPPVEFGGSNGCCVNGNCSPETTGFDQNKYRNNIYEGNYIRIRNDPKPDQSGGMVNLINLDGKDPATTYPPFGVGGAGVSISRCTGAGVTTCDTSNYAPGCCAGGLAIPADQRFQFHTFSARNNVASYLGLPDDYTAAPSGRVFGGGSLNQNGWTIQGDMWFYNNTLITGDRGPASENQSMFGSGGGVTCSDNAIVKNNVAYGSEGARMFGTNGQCGAGNSSDNFQKTGTSYASTSTISTGCPYISCTSLNVSDLNLSASSALLDQGTATIKSDIRQHIRPNATLWDPGAFERSSNPYPFPSGGGGSICGNGIREAGEECDIGATVLLGMARDGCTSECTIIENRYGQDLYTCSTAQPNVCQLVACGNQPRPDCGVGCKN